MLFTNDLLGRKLRRNFQTVLFSLRESNTHLWPTHLHPKLPAEFFGEEHLTDASGGRWRDKGVGGVGGEVVAERQVELLEQQVA